MGKVTSQPAMNRKSQAAFPVSEQSSTVYFQSGAI